MENVLSDSCLLIFQQLNFVGPWRGIKPESEIQGGHLENP